MHFNWSVFPAAFLIHELLLVDDWRPIITSVSSLPRTTKRLAALTGRRNHCSVNVQWHAQECTCVCWLSSSKYSNTFFAVLYLCFILKVCYLDTSVRCRFTLLLYGGKYSPVLSGLFRNEGLSCLRWLDKWARDSFRPSPSLWRSFSIRVCTWEVQLGCGSLFAASPCLHEGAEQCADGVQRVAHPTLQVGDWCNAFMQQLCGNTQFICQLSFCSM